MIYTGIGSRNIPDDIKEKIIHIATHLAECGYTLRSGGADGADTAFEIGALRGNGKKEIFLPWRNFNDNPSVLYEPPQLAFEIARKYHPNWAGLKPSVKRIMARNSQQVLGFDCRTPTQFIVCYTENGEMKGGTSQALRIAIDLNIPIYNLGDPNVNSYSDFLNL